MLSGWFGLYTGLPPNGVPVEAQDYDRVWFILGGSPLTGRLEKIPGPTAPVSAALTHGDLWDSETSGRALFAFALLPDHIVIPGDVPPVEVTVMLTHPVQLAVNASMAGMTEAVVEKGSVIGTWNGQAMIAATRLMVADGTLMSSATKVKTSAKVTA
jgi:hypothetical protein